MSRKRDNRYASSSLPKRRRPMPSPSKEPDTVKPTSAAVVVTGLGSDCSVLDLKSRFEMYGSISRLRIDRGGVGYITFRSKESAQSAINASLDPSFGIIVDSHKVQVSWADDPLPQWREGIGLSSSKERSSSKLLRAEVPLRRHGRGNRLSTGGSVKSGIGLDLPFKGREIVAYDDLL